MFKRNLAIMSSLLLTVLAWGQNSYNATWYVDGNKTKYENRSHTSLECLEQAASAVYATNGVELILTKMRMSKTSGGINAQDRHQTGINSVLLADGGSQLIVEFCEVKSHAVNADGVTASGEGTKIELQEGNITMNREGSWAVNALNGATVAIKKTTVNTESGRSTAFYSYKQGVLEIEEAMGEIAGSLSPIFHSSGVINATKCKLSSAKYAIGNVEGGTLKLIKNELKSGVIGGFQLYGSNDNDIKSVLELNHNTISVPTGPLFLISNISDAQITVTGNKISQKDDMLLEVRADDWGEKGSNGGHGTLNIGKQALRGDILVDSISSLTLNLNKGARLSGQINSKENRSAKIRIKVGAGASWTSKGDSHITSIEFDQPLHKALKQLKGNHTIYYDPSDPANAPLEGKEHKTGGGRICPIK